MSTRGSILQRLSDIPTQDVLRFLPDDILIVLANKCFNDQFMTSARTTFNTENTSITTPQTGNPTNPASDRLKRPLNAFMAFRSYYLKLFPDTQQKTASGFLTNLWGRDPFRNKWALVAKVYSFVRDELGKDKVNLSKFLSLACPIMNIIKPSEYLQELGWIFQEDGNGTQTLVRDQNFSNHTQTAENNCPGTELELLSALVNFGYLPADGEMLVDRMGNSNRSMLTSATTNPSTSASGPGIFAEEANFHDLLNGDLYKATTISDTYRNNGLDIKAHIVEEPGLFKIPEQSLSAETQRYYDSIPMNEPMYPQDGMVLDFGNMHEPKCYDISNPWHLDAIISQQNASQVGIGQLAAHRPSPPYDAEEDFHFAF